jgi:tetratricopeptide (TPR) repeat protein
MDEGARVTSETRGQGVGRRLRSVIIAGLAFGAAVTGAPRADAELGAIHPDVVKASAAVSRAKGPEAYAALRELWRTWDRGEPSHVEEALRAFAEGGTTPPQVRVYAELLSAYARRRRGDLDGAIAKVKDLGFIEQWMTIGPFDNENKGGFGLAYGPERELGEAIAPARTYDGKERAVKWRVSPAESAYGWFDFGVIMRPQENICGYATTFVRAKAKAGGGKGGAGAGAAKPITVWVGSSGAFKLFWNGEQVLEDAGYRELDIDRFAVTLPLGPGWSRLTAKVCGTAESAPKLALRIGDEKGAPNREVELDASVAASEAAAAQAKEQASAKAKAAPKPAAVAIAIKGGVEGPIQTFERMTSGPKPDPAALEAYARYLSISGGDSAPEHKARDLARRAAEAEPTVKRLLLAGDLSEDRNQERSWVEQAAKLAGIGEDGRPTSPAGGKGEGALDVLLAQARLAATSVNWRDAVPLFDRILAIDPDHTGAVLGLVDLYVEAGLKRTALQELEKALARQPSSVALLHAYAGQLRSLGRDTEAAEVEVRYASLRFDDSGFLSQMVELAVARRDTAGAERWLERFLRSEPDSSWARTVAARTYRALGQKDRALAAYQRALAMAPEDIGTLRALSDLYGEEDNREEQLKLLRQILAISPQEKDVREYVEHIEPPKPRADEAYAWAPERFLPMARVNADPRAQPGSSSSIQGYPQRTLRRVTVTTVFPNGLSSNFHQVVFQPLTDDAAARGRQYAFSYAGERQTVTLRAAKVYRQNGKIDEAIESGETGVSDPSIAMYTSQRTFYVSFPRLSPGDVVELRYRVEDTVPRNELADYFGEIEYLQSDEPTLSREYVLITPKSRTFYIHTSPLQNLTKETKEVGDQRIYRFAATDVPPLGFEPAMPPWASVLAHVHVSTFKTWDEVGRWYWGLARDQFDVDDEVRKKVRELTKGLTDDKAKIRAIYKYATETRYVALEFGIEGIRPRRCAQTVARGWGDCKDKATLIVTMLRELGIPSTIVLVRTGMRGDIGDFPASLAPFDHAIAYVPSLDLYLDGTAELTGSNELPAMDRGAVGLQINEGKPKLVRLPQPPAEESVVRRKVDVTLGADAAAQVAIDLAVTGVAAPTYRTRYMAEGTRRERFMADLSSEFGALELLPGAGGAEVSDLRDIEQPVKLKARGKSASLARRDGDSWSVPAMPVQRLTGDYASLSNRTLDVIIPALTMREDEWVLRLPQGMKVLRAPLPLEMDTPYGQYAITVEQAPGKVTVKSRLALKKSRIPVAEYTAWRVFCESVDRAFGQRIVVGK